MTVINISSWVMVLDFFQIIKHQGEMGAKGTSHEKAFPQKVSPSYQSKFYFF